MFTFFFDPPCQKVDFVWMDFMKVWISVLQVFPFETLQGFQIPVQKEEDNKLYATHFVCQRKWNFEIKQNTSTKVHLIRDWPVLINGIFYGSIFSLMSHIPPYCVYNPQIEQFEPGPNIRSPFIVSFFFQDNWLRNISSK